MPKGYLAIVLHAHLPFVRHPEHDTFLEEDWYYEAITETYVPLLRMMWGLQRDGVPFKITMSLTPSLMSMMADGVLARRYEQHLAKLTELCEKELVRTANDPHLSYLAHHYREQIEGTWEVWRALDGRLLDGFRTLLESGDLEVITCGATHGYLPLLRAQPQAVRAQIHVAVDCYTRHMGRPPQGIWLPECGYFPGLDRVLADFGLRYFFVDSHGLLYAHPRPAYDNYAPIYCNGSGVAAFARDEETSAQVWSKQQGYPGDPLYREFYRDIGYDLDQEYIGPYVQHDGTRKNTGIKYHRITGNTDHKELYEPAWAKERAADHAANFMANRQAQIDYLERTMGRPPIVTAPYDAELFGHWWYEGPQWLDYLIRKSAFDQTTYALTTPVEYLRQHPAQQVAVPAESSWGTNGYHEHWLSESNAWIYPHLHKAAERMVDLAQHHPDADGVTRRALNQAARELLLAQSSDWAFIMKTGTMVSYAEQRTVNHLRRFTRLHRDIWASAIDSVWLNRVEALDNIFPEIDYRVYTP